jgi:hypothetical protein
VDGSRDRIALPRIEMTETGADFELPRASRRGGPWYEFSVGRAHSLRGGYSSRLGGGVGGELGTFRTLAALARKKVKCPGGQSWASMEADVLHVGIRVAALFVSGRLEAVLAEELGREARHISERVAADRARTGRGRVLWIRDGR